MNIIFDLENGDKKIRTEYTIGNLTFVPRIGETISLSSFHLKGNFKVTKVVYDTSEIKLGSDKNVGEGKVNYVRIRGDRLKD